MISTEITKKIHEAMKKKEEVRLSTLRMLSSALNYEKIAKQHDLSEDEELSVVQKEAKKRKDAIEAYEKAGAKDRADKEREELKILQEYLPEEMGEEELSKIIEEAVEDYKKDLPADATHQVLQAGMGKIIGTVKSKVGMKADGAKIAQLVKEKLT